MCVCVCVFSWLFGPTDPLQRQLRLLPFPPRGALPLLTTGFASLHSGSLQMLEPVRAQTELLPSFGVVQSEGNCATDLDFFQKQ